MKVEQIAVFVENKAGRLTEITRILAENKINIRALSVADTTDFGILRLIVDQVDNAIKVLQAGGFTVGRNDVAAVQVEDRIGGLAEVLEHISQAGINVEYMYAIVNKAGENAVLVFRFENMEKAMEVLKNTGITIVDGKEVYNL